MRLIKAGFWRAEKERLGDAEALVACEEPHPHDGLITDSEGAARVREGRDHIVVLAEDAEERGFSQEDRRVAHRPISEPGWERAGSVPAELGFVDRDDLVVARRQAQPIE